MSERNGCYIENGVEYWYKDGNLHRDNGPAVISSDIELWYKNGKIHREGGPACVNPMYQEWRIDGEVHREDGPAIVYSNGKTQFCLKGERVPESVIVKIVELKREINELKNENKKLMLELYVPGI